MNVLADYLHTHRIHFGKIAAAILRDVHAGEDVVSSVLETFLEMSYLDVATSLSRFPMDRYVARTVKNRAIDHYRKGQRRGKADPAMIEDSVHGDNTPSDHDSDKFAKSAAIVPECLALLEKTHPKQGQAVRNFLTLLIELDRKPALDEQAARLGADREKLKCNLCLGLKALRKCSVDKGGSDPFKK